MEALKRLVVLAAAVLLSWGWIEGTPWILGLLQRPIDFVQGQHRITFRPERIIFYTDEETVCDSIQVFRSDGAAALSVAMAATSQIGPVSGDTIRTIWPLRAHTPWRIGCFPAQSQRWTYSLRLTDDAERLVMSLGSGEASFGPTSPFRVDVVAEQHRWIYSLTIWGGSLAVFFLLLVLYAGGGAFERGISDPGVWTRAQRIRVAAASITFIGLVWLLLPLRMMAVGADGIEMLNDPLQLISLPIVAFWVVCWRWGRRLGDERRFTHRERVRYRVVTRFGAAWSILAAGIIVWF